MPGSELLWKPSAPFSSLQQRAALLTNIRQFFAERCILEVETPLLSKATVTDRHLHSFKTDYFLDNGHQKQTLYLQTSPEFAMKRLLAAGSGPIYQISKAFRNQGESSRYHNPEFSLLEWYRPGFNHHQLMDEVEVLLSQILAYEPAQRISYAEIFQQYLQFNPHQASLNQLKKIARTHHISIENLVLTTSDDWLNLLITHLIEPRLPQHPIFIYDFPPSQAALSKVRPGNPSVAERFEVYVRGVELANGFHELNSAKEQRQRFMQDLKKRKEAGVPLVPLDECLLTALEQGLPDCAGVALGLDRLLMLTAKKDTIQDVIAFPLERA